MTKQTMDRKKLTEFIANHYPDGVPPHEPEAFWDDLNERKGYIGHCFTVERLDNVYGDSPSIVASVTVDGIVAIYGVPRTEFDGVDDLIDHIEELNDRGHIVRGRITRE